jgi:hypothetical protein
LTEFIFMLTRSDVTVPNALEVLKEVRGTGLRCIGCKDVGLDRGLYANLFGRMRDYGMRSFLEIVTFDEGEHFRGVDLGLEIGADYIIGGMPEYSEKTVGYLRARKGGTRFFPYIGEIAEHPCVLRGTIDDIIEDGREAERLGVDGVNLLLYRYEGDQRALLGEVVSKLRTPLLVAGNISNFEMIEEMKRNDVWAFTIGSAVFKGEFAREKGVRDQIKAVLGVL